MTIISKSACENLSQTLVLLIEDNKTDAVTVKWLFEKYGNERYNLHHVTTLGDGLNYISKHDVDIVLLDQVLPDSTASETFAKLHDRYTDMPVVILSSIQDPVMLTTRMQEGASDYLVKGNIGGPILFQTIDRIIEQYRIVLQKKKNIENTKQHSATMESSIIVRESAHGLNNLLVSIMNLPDIIKEDIEELLKNGDKKLLNDINEDLYQIKLAAEKAVAIVKNLRNL